MPPRLHCPVPLSAGLALALPPQVARHLQVLRVQPGAQVTLFNGEGGEWSATVQRMGRNDVDVQVQAWHEAEREVRCHVTLAVAMPANDRMDGLVEKAVELGVSAVQPLVSERSVLRLSGERAERKVAHWQAVAASACEQSGRTRVPVIAPVASFAAWLAALPAPRDGALRCVLSLRDAAPLAACLQPGMASALFASGPEGGWSPAEEEAALAAGLRPVTLGPRVLRADTAPIAAMAAIALLAG